MILKTSYLEAFHSDQDKLAAEILIWAVEISI